MVTTTSALLLRPRHLLWLNVRRSLAANLCHQRIFTTSGAGVCLYRETCKLFYQRSCVPKLLTRPQPDRAEGLLSQSLVEGLIANGVLVADKDDATVLRPKFRVSGLYPSAKAPNYYVHSSWPTSTSESVFFGAFRRLA